MIPNKPSTEDIEELKKLTTDVEGWIHEEELVLLFCLAKRCKGKGVIVEIGSWKGKSTISLALGSKRGNKVRVYSIDTHTGTPEYEGALLTLEEFKKNIRNARVDDLLVPIVKSSEEAAKDFDEQIELIFIDGEHKYEFVKKDFELWFPKIVDGGIIALHDTTTWPGPKKVSEKYILKSKNFKNVHIVDSIMFAEKTNKISIVDKLKKRIILIPLYGEYVTRRFLIRLNNKLKLYRK